MRNKKGNVVVIAVIIVIVAISAGLVGWMFAKKTQTSENQALVTQPAPISTTQTPQAQSNNQPIEDATSWKLISGNVNDTCSTPTFEGQSIVHGWYKMVDNYGQKEWMLSPVRPRKPVQA